jgi:hypothetical protein
MNMTHLLYTLVYEVFTFIDIICFIPCFLWNLRICCCGHRTPNITSMIIEKLLDVHGYLIVQFEMIIPAHSSHIRIGSYV